MRHVPYWLDQFPKTRRPSYPRLRGSHEARVVIVGGGLTVRRARWRLRPPAFRAMLLEAESIRRRRDGRSRRFACAKVSEVRFRTASRGTA